MPVYTYTTLDDPFALSGTQAMGINATGQIVGSYTNAGGNHGFLYSNGAYTILDDPLASHGTVASGINAADLIVGSYSDNTNAHGFIYNPSTLTYTTLDDPLGTNGTVATAINDSGQVVGWIEDANLVFQAFLYNPNGVFNYLHVGWWLSAVPIEIRNFGDFGMRPEHGGYRGHGLGQIMAGRVANQQDPLAGLHATTFAHDV